MPAHGFITPFEVYPNKPPAFPLAILLLCIESHLKKGMLCFFLAGNVFILSSVQFG